MEAVGVGKTWRVRWGRRFRVSRLVVVGLAGLWASPALALTDLEITKQNALNFLTAAGADRSDPFVSAAISKLNTKAADRLNTQNTNGSWSDLNYTQVPGDSWDVGKHYVRIYEMAQAYRTPGHSLALSPSLRSAIERGLAYGSNYVYPGVTKTGNWWWWKIGVPRRLGPTLVLLEGQIDPKLFATGVDTLAYLIGTVDGGGTSQNAIWTIMNHLYYALLINDPTWMQDNVAKKMTSAVIITTGTTEAGIQTDYAFHQHGPQLYTGGYGGEYAQDVATYVLFTTGTGYQLPSANFDTFITYVAEGPRWALYHNYFDPSVISREVTRPTEKGSSGLAALLMLSQVPNPRQNDFLAAAKQMLSSWNFTFSVEVSGLVTPVQTSTVTSSWPTGHKHYPRSDYTVHRRPGYYASVKMVSDRTVSAEKVNGEGLKSWFLSDGMTYVVMRGDEYYTNNVWPTLDWTRLPGTTVEQKSRSAGGYGYGVRTFVGGAHTDEYGVAAMDFDATKYQKASDGTRTQTVASTSCLTAKKSYFFFDDEVMALGSDINCPSGNLAETIVMQRPLSTATAPLSVDGIAKSSSPGWNETLSNITWAQSDGVGYYFPGGQTLKGKRELRSGKWSDLNTGESTTVYTNPILTLWFDHGTFATNQTYRYAILPGKSSTEMAGYAASVPLSILAHDGRVHAVKDHLLNAVGAVFWAADSVDLVTVDRPCVLFYRTEGDVLTLVASDPARGSSTFHVTVHERLSPLELPEGLTATTTDTSTILTYTTARDGRNYLARFAHLASPASTMSLSASPASVSPGQSATLTWSAADATSCAASGGWSGTKATSGSEVVSPAATATYTLSCTGPGGSVSSRATVTVTPVADTTAPLISLVQVTGITASSAAISWATDEPATSQVAYGLTASYGNLTPLATTLVTAHAVTLSGLAPNTAYHYRVESKDAVGNLATSGDQMLTTAPLANQPPTGQTPWQTNAYGTLKTGLSKNEAMGYHFTPQVPGQITQLGGFFKGTKIVKLFEKATGTLLASASVSAAKTWSYTPIPPVPVSAGTTYTVAVYLVGSGGSKRVNLSPPFPRTFGDIKINGTTSIDTKTNPTARPTNTITDKMLGQADVVFVPTGP